MTSLINCDDIMNMSEYIPPKFEILDHSIEEDRQVNSIKFISGPYAGLVFSYGKVQFVEDEFSEELIMKFDYDVFEESHYMGDDIVTYLGDFLVMLLREQLRYNEVVYTGGTETKDTKYD